jgi:hypothetical protein
LKDPYAEKFFNLCKKSQNISYVIRRGSEGVIDMAGSIPVTRRERIARSEPALASAQWQRRAMVEPSLGLKFTAETFRPAGNLADTWQAILVDASQSSSFEEFLGKILDIWYEVYDCRTAGELFQKKMGPHVEIGTFDDDPAKEMHFVGCVESTEDGAAAIWKLLWGSELPKNRFRFRVEGSRHCQYIDSYLLNFLLG